MADSRMKDIPWLVSDDGGQRARSTEHAQLAVLMDLRDELKALNRLLGCSNFIEVPTILRGIRRNTAKKPRLRIVKKKRRAA